MGRETRPPYSEAHSIAFNLSILILSDNWCDLDALSLTEQSMRGGGQVVSSGDVQSQQLWGIGAEDPYHSLGGATVWNGHPPAPWVGPYTDAILLVGGGDRPTIDSA